MTEKSHICICEASSRLRPSDWAHRLAGLDALFGPDNRLRFSRYLQPVRHNGGQCLRLDSEAQSARPALWQTVMAFAEEHGLRVEQAKAGI
jgi:hypothetical protein